MTVWLAPGKLKTAGPQGVHGLIDEPADAVIVEPGAGEVPSCTAVVINMEGPALRRSRIRHSVRGRRCGKARQSSGLRGQPFQCPAWMLVSVMAGVFAAARLRNSAARTKISPIFWPAS